MARPSKFDMGGIPRTRTGLVPLSYRQQMDEISTPTQWGQLPPKPKQTLYRYRGDFVNRRNRLAQQKEKRTQKQQRSFESSKSESSSSGSKADTSLLVTPRSSATISTVSSPIDFPVAKMTPKWDSYCKHISCHALSAEEETARTQNNSKFVSYMRSEAAKRPARTGLRKKEEDAAPSVRKRKPHVPRLSHLARSRARGEKENQQNGLRSVPGTITQGPGVAIEHQQKGKTKENNARTKVRYLDFISQKVDEAPKRRPCPRRTGSGRSQKKDETAHSADFPSPPKDDNTVCSVDSPPQDDKSDVEDEDSTFRSQIERIVQRAAAMALSEQRKAQRSRTSLNDFSAADESTPDLGANETRQTTGDERSPVTVEMQDDTRQRQDEASTTSSSGETSAMLPCEKLAPPRFAAAETESSTTSSSGDTVDTSTLGCKANTPLATLEEHAETISSSVMMDEEQLGKDYHFWEKDLSQGSVDASFSTCTHRESDSWTGVIPPIHTAGQPGVSHSSMHRLLREIDSSCTTGTRNEMESRSEISDTRALAVLSRFRYHSALPSMDTLPSMDGEQFTCGSSWPGSDTATLGMSTSASTVSRPEEPWPPPVYPAEPPRAVLSEEAPRPRGFEHLVPQRNDYADHARQTVPPEPESEDKELLVDDLFSLLG